MLSIYLFLGGLGGGMLVLTSLMDLIAPKRYRRTVLVVTWAAFGCLIAGSLVLLADVGVPERALMLWRSFTNFGTWMSWGAWALVAAMAMAALHALAAAFMERVSVVRRSLAVLSLVSGGLAVVYTGMLLMSSSAVPAWGTWLLPVLFSLSSLGSAAAGVLVVVRFFERKGQAKKARPFHIVTVVVSLTEGLALCAYVTWLLLGSSYTAPSALMLLVGDYQVMFWLLIVFCGLAVPLVASGLSLLLRTDVAVVVAVAALCALAACLALRFVVLSIGMYVSVALA